MDRINTAVRAGPPVNDLVTRAGWPAAIWTCDPQPARAAMTAADTAHMRTITFIPHLLPSRCRQGL